LKNLLNSQYSNFISAEYLFYTKFFKVSLIFQLVQRGFLYFWS